jgi:hypothetical protein
VIETRETRPLRLESTARGVSIVSPDGRSEVRVSFGSEGPIITVRGARIDLEAEDLRIRLDTLEIEAKRELRLRSDGDVHVNGAVVRLNCSDQRGQC